MQLPVVNVEIDQRRKPLFRRPIAEFSACPHSFAPAVSGRVSAHPLLVYVSGTIA
jgi:hypothetical protein